MYSRKSAVIKGVTLGVLALLAASCGSTSSNDQGTSVTALGFYGVTVSSGAITATTTPETGKIVEISPDSGGFAGLDLNTVLAGIGVQNRLTTQFFRTVRVDFHYDVPGASTTIPDDSTPMTMLLSAAGDGTSTVDSATAIGVVQVVSPDVISYLNINRNLLPDLPFRMNVTATVTGVTQAGDVLTTNEINYFVQFAERDECCTGNTTDQNPAGFDDGGTGSGGNFDTTTSDSTSSASARIVGDEASTVDANQSAVDQILGAAE